MTATTVASVALPAQDQFKPVKMREQEDGGGKTPLKSAGYTIGSTRTNPRSEGF